MKLFKIATIVLAALWLCAQPAHADSLLFTDQFPTSDWKQRWEVVRNFQPHTPSEPCMNQQWPALWEVRNNFLGITLDGPPCVTEIVPKSEFLDLTMFPIIHINSAGFFLRRCSPIAT